jgi:ABC-type Fe3+ transport system permease subunit
MKDSAGSPQSHQNKPGGLSRFARPALIASAVVAVVCIALLVIIFFLDAFNATVYSVGGNDIGDDTQEAQDIRWLYAGARAGSIVFLVASLMVAAAAAVLLYRGRNSAGEADGGEDVDFEDLGR